MIDLSDKKVLFFQHSGNNGGAPRSLLQIVREYEKEFGPQHVLFLRDGPVIPQYRSLGSEIAVGNYFPFHGSEVSGMSWKVAARNMLGLLQVPGAFFRHLRGYDVVYLNSSCLCFYGIMVRLFARETRIICHIREPLLHNVWGAIIRFVLRHSIDYYIAISSNESKNLDLPSVPGEIVYNYVHSSDYVPVRGASLHRIDPTVGAGKFAVGYFARLDDTNGIGDFIEVARLFETDPDWAFCIYGHTGQEVRGVQDMLSAAGPNVHVYPMVQDVPTNLGDLDVLVVPFKVPHFSRSTIEAAMLGVPSVVYDIPSVNETVRDGETGYVVSRNETAMIADRLVRLRTEPGTYSRMSQGARQFAMALFSEANYLRIRDAIIAEDVPPV